MKRTSRLLALCAVLIAAVPARADFAAYQARQNDLVRLAKVLGEAHYIRSLCEPSESEIWRQRMSEMMRLEDPPQKQKNAMIAAFNEGYYASERKFYECTDDARRAVATLAREGRTISDRLIASLQEEGPSYRD